MTETMGTTSGGTTPTSGDASTRDVAKEEARDVAQDAAQGGRQTAETAKQQAGEVTNEAMSQARLLIDQTREQVTAQGTAQQERAASGLRTLADELSGMASGGEQQEGLATDLARQAAERVRSAADMLENRQPSELLDEVRSFARRRPGTFLLGAAAIGFLGGRLTRGLADDARDDSGTPIGTPSAPSAGLPGGYATTQSGPASVQPVSTGVAGAAPASPGYSVTPETEVDPAGDATTQFRPTDSGVQRDQMPTEFGARGTGASGNRPEEGRI
jgi:vacuolar-type H+-ATPase subunit H